VVQSLSGDSWEDTLALLRTLYSVIRCMFAGKQSPAATEMLNRTGALASGFAAYVARRIVESDVCGAGP
jgi:fluoride ion exporter CrcB/FEX